MRRTALTVMHCAGIPLGVLQKISGHRSLQALQKYLEVSEEQVEVAIAGFLDPDSISFVDCKPMSGMERDFGGMAS